MEAQQSWQGMITFMESEIQVNVHPRNPGWTFEGLIRRHCEMGSIIAIMKWLEQTEYSSSLYAGLSHYTLKISAHAPYEYPMIILDAEGVDNFLVKHYESSSQQRHSFAKRCNSRNLKKVLFPLLERLRNHSQ